MNLSEMLSESFKYPTSNVKRWLILGILHATYILIIPAILSLGYSIRIIESSFEDSNELPPFEDWWKMFVDGLKYVVVILVYLFIPSFIAGILGALVTISLIPIDLSFNMFLIVFITIMILVMILPYLLSFMGITRMVKEKSIGAAFQFKEVWNVIKNIGIGRYVVAIVIISVLPLLVSAIASIPQIMNMNTLIIYSVSTIVSLFISSYLTAFEGRLMAHLYQECTKED